MSFSAEDRRPAQKPLDWYDFSGREVPDMRSEFFSPESELVSVANRAAQDLHRAERAARAVASEVREALFDLAVLVGRLEQLTDTVAEPLEEQRRRRLHRQLRTVKNQMLQIMTDNGIELRDPTGLPAAEVLDWVEVSAWLHRPEFDTEVVARTEERAVLHEDRVVRFARVQMGAPAESAQGQDAEPDRGEA
jgi:uncharacterized membrane protein